MQEGLVWQIEDERVDWFVLGGGESVALSPIALSPDAEGRLESRVFPGLVLNTEALLTANVRRALFLPHPHSKPMAQGEPNLMRAVVYRAEGAAGAPSAALRPFGRYAPNGRERFLFTSIPSRVATSWRTSSSSIFDAESIW